MVSVLPDVTTDEPSLQEMEALLAQEMSQLSVEERNEALEDLHAVSSGIGGFSSGAVASDELRTEVAHHLKEWMQRDLAFTASYREALLQDPKYAEDPSFVVPFLRSVNYDAAAAAERIIRHFQWKQSLFGASMLAKDITQDDLDVDDVRLLESGYSEVLPHLDQAGRSIVVCRPSAFDGTFRRENSMRVSWYLGMQRAKEDYVSPTAGVVIVMYNLGERRTSDTMLIRDNVPMKSVLPILPPAAFHVCVDAPECARSFVGIQYKLSKDIRIRSRCHVGQMRDHHETLKRYGIYISPLVISGQAESNLVRRSETNNLLELLGEISRRRQQILLQSSSDEGKTSEDDTPDDEPISDPASVSVTLGRNDVLFGRGNSRRHPGNLRLKEMIRDRSLQYRTSLKVEKTQIVNCILRQIHDCGGRFLRRSTDMNNGLCEEEGWVEVPMAMAREKVCKMFQRSIGKL